MLESQTNASVCDSVHQKAGALRFFPCFPLSNCARCAIIASVSHRVGIRTHRVSVFVGLVSDKSAKGPDGALAHAPIDSWNLLSSVISTSNTLCTITLDSYNKPPGCGLMVVGVGVDDVPVRGPSCRTLHITVCCERENEDRRDVAMRALHSRD